VGPDVGTGVTTIREFPDEEGTETINPPVPAPPIFVPIREFPDEEGTETCHRIQGIAAFLAIREFPDEEGTETCEP
jgi:hypothetical protein